MKKYLFGLSAITLAIASIAFTTPILNVDDPIAFRYVSGDQKLRTSYVEGTVQCSGTPTIVCTILAEQDPSDDLPIFPAGTNPVDNPIPFNTVKKAN